MNENLPAIGATAGKIWGTTKRVFAHNSTDAHVIHIKKGGYCSFHSHKSKWNRFVVISGSLKIKQEPANITIIGPGEVHDVPPGVRHLFEAVEETIVLEFYWVDLDPEDIDRQGTVGGVK